MNQMDYKESTATVRSNLSFTSTRTIPGKSSYTVYLLDGSPVQIQVEKKSKGQELFDECCFNLSPPIDERDYFSLSFDVIEHGELRRTWLDFTKPTAKQMVNAPNKALAMNVKFYPPDPTQLLEYTRYLFYLQLRDDVAKGKMPCAFVTQALLGSYVCQADVGDFEEAMDVNFLYDFAFGPGENSVELIDKIVDLWKSHNGLTTGEAEMNYIENAKKLQMYGTDMHPAIDGEGIEIAIGINYSGVLVFRDGVRINRVVWPKILKISYKRDYFYIRVRPAERDRYEKTIGFKLEGFKAAKRLWKIAIEHHAFFRLVRPEARSKKLKFGSRPNLTFQTEYQVKNSTTGTMRSEYNTFDRYNTLGSQHSLNRSQPSLDRRGYSHRAQSLEDILRHPTTPGGQEYVVEQNFEAPAAVRSDSPSNVQRNDDRRYYDEEPEMDLREQRLPPVAPRPLQPPEPEQSYREPEPPMRPESVYREPEPAPRPPEPVYRDEEPLDAPFERPPEPEYNEDMQIPPSAAIAQSIKKDKKKKEEGTKRKPLIPWLRGKKDKVLSKREPIEPSEQMQPEPEFDDRPQYEPQYQPDDDDDRPPSPPRPDLRSQLDAGPPTGQMQFNPPDFSKGPGFVKGGHKSSFERLQDQGHLRSSVEELQQENQMRPSYNEPPLRDDYNGSIDRNRQYDSRPGDSPPPMRPANPPARYSEPAKPVGVYNRSQPYGRVDLGAPRTEVEINAESDRFQNNRNPPKSSLTKNPGDHRSSFDRLQDEYLGVEPEAPPVVPSKPLLQADAAKAKFFSSNGPAARQPPEPPRKPAIPPKPKKMDDTAWMNPGARQQALAGSSKSPAGSLMDELTSKFSVDKRPLSPDSVASSDMEIVSPSEVMRAPGTLDLKTANLRMQAGSVPDRPTRRQEELPPRIPPQPKNYSSDRSFYQQKTTSSKQVNELDLLDEFARENGLDLGGSGDDLKSSYTQQTTTTTHVSYGRKSYYEQDGFA